MDDVWLDKPARQSKREELEQQQIQCKQRECQVAREVPEVITVGEKPASPPVGDPISDDKESIVGNSLPRDGTESEVEDLREGPAADDDPRLDPPTPAPNIERARDGDTIGVPEGGVPAPEGARPQRRPRKQYPPASKTRDGGGLCSRNKLKSTFSSGAPEMAMTLSRGAKFEPNHAAFVRCSRKRQSGRQRRRQRREQGDVWLNATTM